MSVNFVVMHVLINYRSDAGQLALLYRGELRRAPKAALGSPHIVM